MGISMTDVRALREQSGAGILDCRNALTECEGDMKEALRYLQKKGLADAEKKRGRSTEIGRIFINTNRHNAIILELLCETDFVARNDTFITLGNTIAENLIGIESHEERQKAALPLINESIAIIKENIRLGRHEVTALTPQERVNHYIHGDDGALGTLIVATVDGNDSATNGDIDKELTTLLHDLAMHISARRPHYRTKDDIPEEYRAEQLKIFTEQAKSSGKPQPIVEKIARGKLEKHLGEITLMGQGFVKEEKKNVAQILSEHAKRTQQNVSISHFVCYKAGEEA